MNIQFEINAILWAVSSLLFLLFFFLSVLKLIYLFQNRKKIEKIQKSLENNKKDFFKLKKFVINSQKQIKILFLEFPYLSLWVFFTFFLMTFGLSFLIMWFYSLFFTYPQIVSTYPSWNSTWNEYDKPIEVVFDKPIDTESLIINMSPNTEGEWKFESEYPISPLKRKIKFYPKETVYPGYDVIVYFTHVTNVFDTIDNREESIQFKSVEVPTIISSYPENDSTKVPVDTEIVFNLSHKEGSFVDWEFVTNHKDKTFSVLRDNTDSIKFRFDEPMIQGEGYIIKVFQIPLSKDMTTGEIKKSEKKKEVYLLKFDTVAPPLVVNMAPQGNNVSTNSEIVIKFQNDMDKTSVENAFSITPNTNGTKEWRDGRTFVFKPTILAKDTGYTIRLESGMKSLEGGISNNLVTFNFKTIGKVAVSNWFPGSGSTGIKRDSLIRVTFNQSVDHDSAESNLLLTPQIEGQFSWDGNTLIFDPINELDYYVKYTVSLVSGIKSIDGLDSDQDFSSSFTTEVKQVQLDVPLRSQKNSKECQIIAVQMLLAYKGISKSSNQIFNELPKQTVVCDAENNTWGNPNLGFVGEINGNHDCASGNRGYGIYWYPISSYLSSNGVSNEVKTSWNVLGLTNAIDQGHPVMLWWQNGWSTPTNVSWNTPDGQYIYAVNGMHSEIVVGYIGSSQNPTHIILNDPWRGRRTMEIGTFQSLWGYFNNTGIVVY